MNQNSERSIEKRRDRRIDTTVPVELVIEGRIVAGALRDLSRGGLGVTVAKAAQPPATGAIEIRVDDPALAASVRLEGTVIDNHELDANSVCLHVQFMNLGVEQLRALALLMRAVLATTEPEIVRSATFSDTEIDDFFLSLRTSK